MNKMNNKGPLIVPLATPLLTVVNSDITLAYFDTKKRPVEKFENYIRRFPPIPTLDNSESNAFSRSIYIISIFDLSSNINVQSFKHSNKFVVLDLRERNHVGIQL